MCNPLLSLSAQRIRWRVENDVPSHQCMPKQLPQSQAVHHRPICCIDQPLTNQLSRSKSSEWTVQQLGRFWNQARSLLDDRSNSLRRNTLTILLANANQNRSAVQINLKKIDIHKSTVRTEDNEIDQIWSEVCLLRVYVSRHQESPQLYRHNQLFKTRFCSCSTNCPVGQSKWPPRRTDMPSISERARWLVVFTTVMLLSKMWEMKGEIQHENSFGRKRWQGDRVRF